MTCDKHHLMWVRDRLINVNHDSPYMDFIYRLNDMIPRQIQCMPSCKCELFWEYETTGKLFSDGTPVEIYEDLEGYAI